MSKLLELVGNVYSQGYMGGWDGAEGSDATKAAEEIRKAVLEEQGGFLMREKDADPVSRAVQERKALFESLIEYHELGMDLCNPESDAYKKHYLFVVKLRRLL